MKIHRGGFISPSLHKMLSTLLLVVAFSGPFIGGADAFAFSSSSLQKSLSFAQATKNTKSPRDKSRSCTSVVQNEPAVGVVHLKTTTLFLSSTSNEDSQVFSAPSAIHIASAASSLKKMGVIVVKYGGNAMTSPELAKAFCQDVATLQNLGFKVVVVHGGGPQISNMLKQMNVESKFAENGMRISTAEVVSIAEMVLCGSVNKQISSGICSAGGKAIGISGRDDCLLQCTKQVGDGVDLGFVGTVETVNTDLLFALLYTGITPVIAPIGCGIGEEADVVYNVNADVAAGRIAGELRAARVLFLTDIAGVLDKEKKLLQQLHVEDVEALIKDETITGGMIPKVKFATDAIKLGVEGAFITDGRVPHALLNEILGGGAEGMGSGGGGTIITQ